jgi:hypothetical protein
LEHTDSRKKETSVDILSTGRPPKVLFCLLNNFNGLRRVSEQWSGKGIKFIGEGAVVTLLVNMSGHSDSVVSLSLAAFCFLEAILEFLPSSGIVSI